MMRSLSTFSMDDSPVVFEPDLSSMREVSDTETLMSAINEKSDSSYELSDKSMSSDTSDTEKQSIPSKISTDYVASKKKGKKSNLQAESKAILKKARQEKDKLRQIATRANETVEKRTNRLEKGRIYQEQRRAKETPKVNEKRLKTEN